MLSFTMHYIRTWLSIAPIFLLAGCWEKIEYSGSAVAKKSPTSATTEISSNAPASNDAPSATPVASIPEPTTGSEAASTSEPPPASTTAPISSAAPAALPTSDDDRYAMPAKATEPSTFTPPPQAESTRENTTSLPTTRHTDVAPVSATIEMKPQLHLPQSRRAAWRLGSRLSRAALAHDQGMAANNVPGWLDEARSAAKLLETSFTDLPQPAAANDPAPASPQVIDYLIGQGQTIGRDLSQRHGQEHAALVEIALKSNLLLLLYSPGSNDSNSIAAAISRAAPLAKLPVELCKPVVDHVTKGSSLNDVRTAVKQMHADIDRYLATAAESAGR
jgi:hypothetical protein